MRTYRIAPMKIGKYNVVVVWLSRNYIGKEEEIEKSQRYFRNMLGVEEIVILMVNEAERPFYHGRAEITDQFDNNSYRRFPWQEYTIEE